MNREYFTMKTLIIYDSVTGKTELMCASLQQSLFGEMVRIPESRPYNRITVYLRGIPGALHGVGCAIRPIEEDVSSYERIVLASPVWVDRVIPPITAFLQSYDLKGKEVHALLTYGTTAKRAPLQMKALIEAAEARCASVVCIRSDTELLKRLKSGKTALRLDSERGIYLADP